VYVDGKWQIADITNYDTARSMTWLLTQTYPKQDKNPAETMFLQEALVPGSTK
jgi:type III secretory pathway lipoprotein EscJ